jgi:hypothetical protein
MSAVSQPFAVPAGPSGASGHDLVEALAGRLPGSWRICAGRLGNAREVEPLTISLVSVQGARRRPQDLQLSAGFLGRSGSA